MLEGTKLWGEVDVAKLYHGGSDLKSKYNALVSGRYTLKAGVKS